MRRMNRHLVSESNENREFSRFKREILNYADKIGIEVTSITLHPGHVGLEDMSEPYVNVVLRQRNRKFYNQSFGRDFGDVSFHYSKGFVDSVKKWLDEEKVKQANEDAEDLLYDMIYDMPKLHRKGEDEEKTIKRCLKKYASEIERLIEPIAEMYGVDEDSVYDELHDELTDRINIKL